MNKKAIETVIAIIFLIIFEGFLILAGPSLWGRDKAYHIWGNANMLLCFGTAIFSVIIRMLKKIRKMIMQKAMVQGQYNGFKTD